MSLVTELIKKKETAGVADLAKERKEEPATPQLHLQEYRPQ